MIQYLIILLDDTSTSYCHYRNGKSRNLITLKDLKEGVFYAMKENLMVQYVLPEYELSLEYKEVMNSIDNHLIVPSTCEDENAIEAADVIVLESWDALSSWKYNQSQCYVLRTSKEDFFDRFLMLKVAIEQSLRFNVVFTDVESFRDVDFDRYKQILNTLGQFVFKEYVKGHYVQFNLLTDRMILDKMNNCGAADTNITLAPDGKFYSCPAFYYDGVCDGKELSQGDVCQKGYSVGSLKDGLDVKNQQLYKIDYSPLCRNCDAFQCKRCVWLNRKTTFEVNIPSHEQCVIAHLERNASKELLQNIRKHGTFLPEKEDIKEIDYLDPFDKRETW